MAGRFPASCKAVSPTSSCASVRPSGQQPLDHERIAPGRGPVQRGFPAIHGFGGSHVGAEYEEAFDQAEFTRNRGPM